MPAYISRWDPFREAMSLRDAMNRLIEESVVRPAWGTRNGDGGGEPALRLPVDAYSTADALVITTAVPGVKPEDVEITIEGDTLTIRGELPAPLGNVNVLLQERAHGRFERTLLLNVPVQGDKAEARFENGLLTISVPKAEAVRPRAIKVTTKQ